MALFVEERFNTEIRYGLTGGPMWSTTITEVASGVEEVNINWTAPLGGWTLAQDMYNKAETDYLIAFFNARLGRAVGFRFKDWSDFKVSGTGSTPTGVTATSGSQLQLYRRYWTTTRYIDRIVQKPVAGTVILYKDGVPLASTAYTVDYTTGLITVTTGTGVYTWTGEFDKPVRFATDKLDVQFMGYRESDGEAIFELSGLTIKEIRLAPAFTAVPTMLVGGSVLPAISPAPPPTGSAPAPTPTPAPAPGSSPVPFLLGVNLHTGPGNTTDNTTWATTLRASNMRVNRVDLWGGTPDANLRDLVTKIVANGGKVQGIIHTATEADMTIYTGSGLTTVQNDSNTQASAIINAWKDLILDFEMFNETQLRSDLRTQVTYNAQGDSTTNYDASTAAASVAARLKGVSDAIASIRTSSGLALRAIMGFVGRDFGWGTYLQSKGVAWDVSGFHMYVGLNDGNVITAQTIGGIDYGTGGFLGQLHAFGKPITINEWNAGEHYLTGYTDTVGTTLYEQGLQSLSKHTQELIGTTIAIESVLAYEYVDEPSKSFPENMFGLMRDTNTMKVDMELWTAFAGGALTTAQQSDITSRNLLTDAQIASYRGTVAAPAPGAAPFYPFGSRLRSYVAGTIAPSNDTTSGMDTFLKGRYDYWKGANVVNVSTAFGQVPAGSSYVNFAQAGGDSSGANIAVSEGMGYGLLIAVLFAGYDTGAQTLFDRLLKFVLAFPASGMVASGISAGANLMSWEVDASGSDANSNWFALDGDLDIAMALLMADYQWGSGGTYNYRQLALNRIAAIKAAGFATDGTITAAKVQGDNRSSDYMYGHFRAFKKATSDTFWDNAVAKQLAITQYLQTHSSPNTGLLPDWVSGVLTGAPYPSTNLADDGGANPNVMYYWFNACRDPWRSAADYVLSGDTAIKATVTKMEDFFVADTGGVVGNLVTGYKLDGTHIGSLNPGGYVVPPFQCPIMVGACVSSTYQTWLNNHWTYLKTHNETGYYGPELQILCGTLVAGNWWTP
jgi:uncharacterized protein (TIGR02217 family)